jgi:hypothetical protein
MSFDPSISLGSLIAAGSSFAGVIVFIVSLKGDVGRLTQDVTGINTRLDKVTEALSELAAQKARTDGLDRRLQLVEERDYEKRSVPVAA